MTSIEQAIWWDGVYVGQAFGYSVGRATRVLRQFKARSMEIGKLAERAIKGA